ncbi:hypothetical protein PQ469_10300 [Mucilaginibacter sp. KACC 22773]|uniref:hypothetical protein n=1 Tax=Mucilaginibacter sp. KACC 22773 TaxID=3025671 RepID=UPI002365430B|nr:hypothetical protein [Mucilaginibacter sp. KACC 22773]WDF80396.1 hypothetical protein PQ469_10300 [Mucilaginibacter sp. KACC 22773]
MKYILLVCFCFFAGIGLAQKMQCACGTDSNLNEIIDCKSTIFKNGARLYWQFNCDSSWLTFKAVNGRKRILFSLDSSLMELTGRLGYIYAAEYKYVFLIRQNLISGCCDPPEFILFNKNTGRQKSLLGRLVFYSHDSKYPIVISLGPNSNSLIIFNVDTHKKYSIALPRGRLSKSIKLSFFSAPELLFDNDLIKGDSLVLKYQYKTTAKKDWLYSKILIDLKK